MTCNKKRLKRACYFFTGSLWMFSFMGCNTSNASFVATLFWQRNIISPIKENHVISIDVIEIDSSAHGVFERKYTYIKDNSNFIYLQYHADSASLFAYLFTQDSVLYINTRDKELMIGLFGEAYYDWAYTQVMHSNLHMINPILLPSGKSMKPLDIQDTMMHHTLYKVLYYDNKNTFSFNEASGEYDIPAFYHVRYFYNTATNSLDFIEETPFVFKRSSAKITSYLRIADTINVEKIQNLFDFDNPAYADFSKHNDHFHPYSRTTRQESQPVLSTLTDSVMNYPIVSLQNDTTTLGKERGWLLLDFWFFECPGCIQWFEILKAEKDLHGYRVLEKNGIRILSINAISNNNTCIETFAEVHQMKDIAYHAKGIGNILDMRIMPQYYLISPDKQVVYKSNHLGDYSEMLTAKKNYENNRK